MFLGGVAEEASEEGDDGYRHPLQDLEAAEKGIGVGKGDQGLRLRHAVSAPLVAE